MTEQLAFRECEPQDQAEARQLILAGLEERWGWRDPSKNLDLDDIATSYADAVFLVASRAGRIVGTGALVPRDGSVAEIVRMSVRADMRRQGIGSAMLEQLLASARKAGFRRVILETTATWDDVIAFYRRHGFAFTGRRDGDAYFALEPVASGNVRP